MKARTSLFSWLAIAVFIPLTLSSQTTQTAQTGQPQVEQPLINPVSSTLTGTFIPATTVQTDPNDPSTVTAVPAACQFSMSLAAKEQAVEARRTSDISVDAANHTCSAQFDIGEPPVETTPTSAEAANLANTSTASSSDLPVDTTTGATPDATLASITSAGFLKTWWIDPINITVNSVQDSTKWRWSGTGHCVTGLLGGQALTWFTPSGWLKLSNTFQNTFNCTQTTVASTALFDNPVFCALNSTFAAYNNRVNGKQNGALVGTWNDSVFGSVCVNLLRFRVQLKRTLN